MILCYVMCIILYVFSIAPGNVWTPLWESVGKTMENFEKTKKSGEDAQVLRHFFFNINIISYVKVRVLASPSAAFGYVFQQPGDVSGVLPP